MAARILVVEDNAPNLELMTYLLRAHGHATDAASDGLSGLEAALEGEYDLVLTDILMPRSDGYALVKRLRANPRVANTKVVAITALAMVGDRERILAGGFDGYVAKPIDPETFVREIERYLPPERRSGAAPEHETLEPHEAPEAAGPLVLIVDDIALNREVVRGALGPLGFRISEARNASEAKAKIRESKPALILCDVHMPGGSGFELAQEVKADEELREIPFLFISSTVWRASDRQRAAELGAGNLVLRPIDPERLQREVKRMLESANDAGHSDS
jgi:two-component system, cell cycle response regulator